MASVAGLKSGLGMWTVPGSRGCRCLRVAAGVQPRLIQGVRGLPCSLARWQFPGPRSLRSGRDVLQVQPVRSEMPHGSPGPRWPQENGSPLICSRLKCGGDITANWQ